MQRLAREVTAIRSRLINCLSVFRSFVTWETPQERVEELVVLLCSLLHPSESLSESIESIHSSNRSLSPFVAGFDSFKRMRRTIKDISFGEDSRKYRRTVYSHDDWKKHRSQDRFVYYLAAIFKSGV